MLNGNVVCTVAGKVKGPYQPACIEAAPPGRQSRFPLHRMLRGALAGGCKKQ